MRALLLALLLLAPAVAQACSGQIVMSCAIGAKQVEVCLNGFTANYSYGKPGRSPDLTLAEPVSSLRYTPWNGIGRSIYEEVAFTNAGHSYTVWTAFDRQVTEDAPGQQLSGGIVVAQGETELASLMCKPESITAGLDRLFDAKAEVGQCWNHSGFEWEACQN